jgi:Ca-activated chloride channel family protein
MGRKPSNLVFLIDVSGSMSPPERLPLLKSGLRMFVDKLTEDDTVSIVVYAGASGIALQPTSGEKKEVIQRAIENLQSGGSTNGAAGIQLAYDLAVSNFIRGGINRVILATDGDFNVGITNRDDLHRLIEERAKSGVFLTALGFGVGNLKDATLEMLADKGNGHYVYIDSINEARKVLVEEMGATLVTIAKDVKLQVEFNPAQVNAYRLIGYENRALRTEDFNNDLKDAGDMGAGHTVTALFEVVPAGVKLDATGVESLRYQPGAVAPAAAAAHLLRDAAVAKEMLNLKIRYKDPEGTESKLLELPLVDRGTSFPNASPDFRFAASVAAFGMILRDSSFKGSANLDWVRTTAANSRGADRNGYREEFVRLVQRAMQIGPALAR